MIDEESQGICKLCGEKKSFQLPNKANEKLTAYERNFANRFKLARDYPLQGILDKSVKVY